MKTKLIIFFGLLQTFSVFGADQRLIECPESIWIESQDKLVESADKTTWNEGVLPSRRYLSDMTLWEGKPRTKEVHSLSPSDDPKIKMPEKGNNWLLSPKSKQGYWLECHYEFTSKTLFKQIPNEARTCIWYSSKVFDRSAENIYCY